MRWAKLVSLYCDIFKTFSFVIKLCTILNFVFRLFHDKRTLIIMRVIKNHSVPVFQTIYIVGRKNVEHILTIAIVLLVDFCTFCKVSQADIAVRGNHLTATGNRMPYGITQSCHPAEVTLYTSLFHQLMVAYTKETNLTK